MLKTIVNDSLMLSRLDTARRAKVAPFLALDIMKEARRREAAGESIIHMEVGEPGFETPLSIRKAVAATLESGRIGYTEGLGLPALRSRIAQHYSDVYGVHVPPSRIAVTTGSSSGFILSFLALFNPGDRVAIASPGYPPYRTILETLGIEVVEIETGPETRWALSGEAIARQHAQTPLDGVLVMSPANPSGTVITPDALSTIAQVCRHFNIRMMSDEIYHGLTYGAVTQTALKYDDNALVINSFSKYWCMTGWRIGWLVIPEYMIECMERLAQSLFISVPLLSQVAAIAAFDAFDEIHEIRDVYAKNRAFMLENMPAIGLPDFLPADGGFYLYTNVSRYTGNSLQFAKELLDATGVATTPGVDFDARRGHHYLRVSFAESFDKVREGVRRMGKWVGK
jgi:aspartate/methionine/tyrosine aminotransferase